jgi:hypothetical protein
MLFVTFPLTAALVFAAAPLSEPPMRSSPSASPSGLTTAYESSSPRSGAQAAMLAPALLRAAPGPSRGVVLGRSRPPLAARAMVVVAKGVERVDIQAP